MLASFNQRLCLAVCIFGLQIAAPSFAETSLGIPAVVPYAEDSDVRQAIKDE